MLRCRFRSYTDPKVAATSNKSKLHRSNSNSDIRTVKTWREGSALVGDNLCPMFCEQKREMTTNVIRKTLLVLSRHSSIEPTEAQLI